MFGTCTPDLIYGPTFPQKFLAQVDWFHSYMELCNFSVIKCISHFWVFRLHLLLNEYIKPFTWVNFLIGNHLSMLASSIVIAFCYRIVTKQSYNSGYFDLDFNLYPCTWLILWLSFSQKIPCLRLPVPQLYGTLLLLNNFSDFIIIN